MDKKLKIKSDRFKNPKNCLFILTAYAKIKPHSTIRKYILWYSLDGGKKFYWKSYYGMNMTEIPFSDYNEIDESTFF